MQEIQKEWNALVETADNTQGEEGVEKYGIKNEKLDMMLDDILEKHLSVDDLRLLAATCNSIPDRTTERTAFQNSVLDYMVKSFLEKGDRKSLVSLLSTRIPDPVDYSNIELCLVHYGNKLKDPIMVLGEAYEKSQVPFTRRMIADALRRGFTSLGVTGEKDDEFVKNAMKWYMDNKDHIVAIQHGYYPVGVPCPPLDVREQMTKGPPRDPHYEKHPPLFIEKPSTVPVQRKLTTDKKENDFPQNSQNSGENAIE